MAALLRLFEFTADFLAVKLYSPQGDATYSDTLHAGLWARYLY